MSEIIKGLVQSGGTGLNGKYSFVDADTLRGEDGKRYRLQGVDAPEITKFFAGNEENDPQFTSGTAGSAAATPAIQNLAREQRFTNVVKTGKFDPHGREIIELHNNKGENFTTRLVETGVLQTGKYTTHDDVVAQNVAELFGDKIQRESDPAFREAAKVVQDAIAADTGDKLQFKQRAINEAQYAANPICTHLQCSSVIQTGTLITLLAPHSLKPGIQVGWVWLSLHMDSLS